LRGRLCRPQQIRVHARLHAVGHYAGYNIVGRTEVEPIPKKTGRLWLFGLYPVLAPADQRGVGIIRYRFADPTRADDQWTWLPGARRLRRLNEAILSNPSGLGAWNPDHYGGFNPKVEEFKPIRTVGRSGRFTECG
jgi:hypothetical protein